MALEGRAFPVSVPAVIAVVVAGGVAIGVFWSTVVAAVASVPAESSSPEPRRLFGEDQEREFKGFGEADVLELGGGGPGG